jgi:hypothetical protein
MWVAHVIRQLIAVVGDVLRAGLLRIRLKIIEIWENILVGLIVHKRFCHGLRR